MLRNPAYAGIYAYGRSRTDPSRRLPGREHSGRMRGLEAGSGWSASRARCRPISAWSSTSATWRGWPPTGERIWAALKNYVANTAVTWPGPPHQATRKLGGASHTRTAQGIVSNGPLATSTVKVIHTAPCDLTDGRYDHTTPLGKLI